MLAGLAVAGTPGPESIRRIADEVIRRPDYQLEPGTDYRTPVLVWVVEFLWWLTTPIRALFASLYDISPALAWVVVALLVVVLMALLAHIALTFRQALRVRVLGRSEVRKARELDPADLERRASAAAGAEDYIAAVRWLFQAAFLRLQRAERRPLRRGITNRELLRRYQSTPAAGPLRLFVETIDLKWYGREPCEAPDYQRCAAAYEQICRFAGEVALADRP